MTEHQNNNREQRLQLHFRLFRGAAVLLLLTLGSCYVVWQLQVHDQRMRQALLARTRMMAEAINVDRIATLIDSPEGVVKQEHIRLQKQLTIVKDDNPDLRVIYLLGQHSDGRIFLFLGSESVDQSDYLQPGFVYKDTPLPLRQENGKWAETVEGPLVDQQGAWISALVPVRNTLTGEPLASLGVSLDAHAWKKDLLQHVLPGILTTFMLIAIVLTGSRFWLRRHYLGHAARRCMLCVEPATTLAFGVCLSLFAGWHFYEAEQWRCQEGFYQLAQIKTKEMANSIRQIRSELNALEKFIVTREKVSNSDFRLFCSAFSENSLVWGWNWAPLVNAVDKDQFILKARAAGDPAFDIWQKNWQGERCSVFARDVYYPVLYVAPEVGREQVRGFDVGSELLRRNGIRDAIHSGMPAASEPIGLIFETSAPLGFLVFRPVFSQAGDGGVLGVVFAAIEAEMLVNPYKHHCNFVHMDLRLCGEQGHNRKLATCPQPAPYDYGIASLTRPMFAFGKVFALTAHPGPAFVQGYPMREQAAKTAGMGMALALAIAIIVKLIIRRGYELEHLVSERTQELSESEIRFKELAEQSRMVLWRVDVSGLFTYVSHICADVYGYTADELVQRRHFYDLHPTEGWEAFRQAMLAMLAESKAFNDYIHPLQSKDGRLLVLSTSAVPLLDADGHCIGYHGSDKDVTERERMNAELRRSQAAAEAANQAKSEFLANMSHEIRTPINGVIGVTDMLQESALDHEQHHLVDIINGSGKLLLALINNILDFSRVEAGKVELYPVDFDVDDLLAGLCGGLALRAEEKGVELVLDVQPEVPRCLHGDNLRLLEILMNLVGNAVKFTERGAVVLRVRLERMEAGRAVLGFVVQDSGIGIAKDQFTFLFDAFYQGDSSIRRKHGGTGLGLPIASRLAECMGGTITFSSELGVGSEFCFSLPMQVLDQAEQTLSVWRPEVAGVRVLVADDNQAVRLNVQALLVARGMSVSVAASAEEAVALSRQAAARGEPFRLALIDGKFSDDGVSQLAAALHQAAGADQCAVITLIPLGCRGVDGILARLGVSEVLKKPLNRPALGKAVSAALFGPVVGRSGIGGGAQKDVLADVSVLSPAAGANEILLVEDNSTNQKVALLILKRLGLRADVAGNGLEALELLSENAYQAVLMDIQMPEMDGFAATRCIRDPSSRVRNHNIPIIAMTAHAMNGYRADCQRAGMDDYISKPITPKQMREVLSRWVSSLSAEES